MRPFQRPYWRHLFLIDLRILLLLKVIGAISISWWWVVGAGALSLIAELFGYLSDQNTPALASIEAKESK